MYVVYLLILLARSIGPFSCLLARTREQNVQSI